MRQAGMLAAAASYALDHHVDRLADDHALARRLAEGLAGVAGLQVEPPQTNILFVDLTGEARDRSAGLLEHLAAQGVKATGLYRLRFVAHLDVDAAGVDRAIAAIRRFFGA
jgi:threonine aldolase